MILLLASLKADALEDIDFEEGTSTYAHLDHKCIWVCEYYATRTLKTISSLSAGDHHYSVSAAVMFAALIWVQPGCCRKKVLEHSELRKEQASLAWVEIPFAALLYLSTACASSPDEIRKVGQWRAKQGCSTGLLEAGKEADEGAGGRWGGRGLCMEDISPRLKPGSRRPLSWFDFLLCCST